MAYTAGPMSRTVRSIGIARADGPNRGVNEVALIQWPWRRALHRVDVDAALDFSNPVGRELAAVRVGRLEDRLARGITEDVRIAQYDDRVIERVPNPAAEGSVAHGRTADPAGNRPNPALWVRHLHAARQGLDDVRDDRHLLPGPRRRPAELCRDSPLCRQLGLGKLMRGVQREGRSAWLVFRLSPCGQRRQREPRSAGMDRCAGTPAGTRVSPLTVAASRQPSGPSINVRAIHSIRRRSIGHAPTFAMMCQCSTRRSTRPGHRPEREGTDVKGTT